MERQSTKHGPRLDEELHREIEPLERGASVESHVEEFKEKEDVDADLGGDPALARRELSRHLDAGVFPGDREELLACAREHRAPDHVLELLEELPAGERFETVHAVWEALARLEPSRALEFEEAEERRRVG